jgi:hypothetical protein
MDDRQLIGATKEAISDGMQRNTVFIKLFNSTVQTVPLLGYEKVLWDTEVANVGGFELRSRADVVIPQSGVYVIGFKIHINQTANKSGIVLAHLIENGSNVLKLYDNEDDVGTTASDVEYEWSTEEYCQRGDLVYLIVNAIGSSGVGEITDTVVHEHHSPMLYLRLIN